MKSGHRNKLTCSSEYVSVRIKIIISNISSRKGFWGFYLPFQPSIPHACKAMSHSILVSRLLLFLMSDCLAHLNALL